MRLAAFEGFTVDETWSPGRPTMPSCCTACRPIAARRSPMASSRARSRWSGARRPTAARPCGAPVLGSRRIAHEWPGARPPDQEPAAAPDHQVAGVPAGHEPVTAGRAVGEPRESRPPRPRSLGPRGSGRREGPAARGRDGYALPELPGPDRAEDHLRRVLGEWVVEAAHSANSSWCARLRARARGRLCTGPQRDRRPARHRCRRRHRLVIADEHIGGERWPTTWATSRDCRHDQDRSNGKEEE